LLRFHPHPSQRRSIGQTIGLTAYPPQRAAIFTMPLLTRTFPAYFRLRALFEVSDISTTSEPTVPSGIVSFGPADPVCARHLSCKGSPTPRPEVGSLRSPHYGHSPETRSRGIRAHIINWSRGFTAFVCSVLIGQGESRTPFPLCPRIVGFHVFPQPARVNA